MKEEVDPAVLGGLAQAVPQVDPSPELRARVLASVGDVRAAGPSPQPAAEPRSYLPWLAAAASLALASGLMFYTAQLRNRISTLETDLQQARLRADASDRQTADALQVTFNAQASLAVLTAPDVARVDLAGQPVAPGATARAFWSRSRGLVFTGANLPQLPAGRTYQLWVVTAQAPISAGLLRPDPQGGVRGTFATSPDIPAPVAMAVTIEPDGGVPAPTGDRYLIGTL